jgi:hypothetical protein
MQMTPYKMLNRRFIFLIAVSLYCRVDFEMVMGDCFAFEVSAILGILSKLGVSLFFSSFPVSNGVDVNLVVR